MNRKLLLLLAVGLAGNAPASDLFSFKPTLLHPSGSFFPAARIASGNKKEWEFGRPDRFSLWEYSLKSTVSTKPKDDTENTTFDLHGGLSWDLDDVPPPVQTFPGRGNTSINPVPLPLSSGSHWGSIDAELAAAFEGNESMANKQWTYGVRFNYTPALNHLIDQWWMPFLWVDYRRVSEISTELTAKIGSPAQDYWRFGTEVYWQVPLTVFGDGVLKSVKLVPGFQYHRSTDRKIAAGDLNDAYYYSVALDYAVPTRLAWSKQISAIRLQVATGRIPPSLESRTTVSLAITVHWDQLLH